MLPMLKMIMSYKGPTEEERRKAAVKNAGKTGDVLELYRLAEKAKAKTENVPVEEEEEEKDFAYAVVLTDGMWCSGPCNQARRAKGDFEKEGYDTVGMGFGSADQAFLKEISTKSELAKVDKLSSLNENLSSIARIISS